MVGYMPLEHGILVRVQVPEHYKIYKIKLKNMATWANKKRTARKLKRRNRTKLSKNKR